MTTNIETEQMIEHKIGRDKEKTEASIARLQTTVHASDMSIHLPCKIQV